MATSCDLSFGHGTNKRGGKTCFLVSSPVLMTFSCGEWLVVYLFESFFFGQGEEKQKIERN